MYTQAHWFRIYSTLLRTCLEFRASDYQPIAGDWLCSFMAPIRILLHNPLCIMNLRSFGFVQIGFVFSKSTQIPRPFSTNSGPFALFVLSAVRYTLYYTLFTIHDSRYTIS